MTSAYYGAGRAAIRGDVSISVSLEESAGRIVIALVRTIFVSFGLWTLGRNNDRKWTYFIWFV
jgi:hypothetical protein